MIQIDIQPLRQRLLPETDWRPWKKPNPTLEIDKWVRKQGLQRGDLPAHFEQEGCPYWYVRRGLVTAVQEAQRRRFEVGDRWIEDAEENIRPKETQYAVGFDNDVVGPANDLTHTRHGLRKLSLPRAHPIGMRRSGGQEA